MAQNRIFWLTLCWLTWDIHNFRTHLAVHHSTRAWIFFWAQHGAQKKLFKNRWLRLQMTSFSSKSPICSFQVLLRNRQNLTQPPSYFLQEGFAHEISCGPSPTGLWSSSLRLEGPHLALSAPPAAVAKAFSDILDLQIPWVLWRSSAVFHCKRNITMLMFPCSSVPPSLLIIPWKTRQSVALSKHLGKSYAQQSKNVAKIMSRIEIAIKIIKCRAPKPLIIWEAKQEGSSVDLQLLHKLGRLDKRLPVGGAKDRWSSQILIENSL